MQAARAGDLPRRCRQRPASGLHLGEGGASGFTVDVDDVYAGCRAAGDADVGVGVLAPPAGDRLDVAGGVVNPVPGQRPLAAAWQQQPSLAVRHRRSPLLPKPHCRRPSQAASPGPANVASQRSASVMRISVRLPTFTARSRPAFSSS